MVGDVEGMLWPGGGNLNKILHRILHGNSAETKHISASARGGFCRIWLQNLAAGFLGSFRGHSEILQPNSASKFCTKQQKTC